MARVESDREDLMREAVALVRRIEVQFEESEPIVVGFRPNGWLSVYFAADPMYQFDENGRLRRAFQNGLLYRTQGQTLARLRRDRSEHEVSLLRTDLDVSELEDFRQQMLTKVTELKQRMANATVTVIRRIPDDDKQLLVDIAQFLEQVVKSEDFLAPAISGRT